MVQLIHYYLLISITLRMQDETSANEIVERLDWLQFSNSWFPTCWSSGSLTEDDIFFFV